MTFERGDSMLINQTGLVYQASDFIQNPRGYSSMVSAEARSLSIHSHDFYEIAYVMEGWGTHHTDSSSQRIQEGDYLLITPGIRHCIVSPAESSIPRIRVCNCLFTAAFFSPVIRHVLDLPSMRHTSLFSLLSGSSPFCLILRDDAFHSIRTTLRMIQYAINQPPQQPFRDTHGDPEVLSGTEVMIRNHLENFLIATGDIYESRLSEDALPGRNDRLIQNLTSYIRSHLDLPLSLSSLAERVHFSPEYLSRYFKRHTGQTISSYLSDVRMKKAEELLLHTAYPISEIGYLCGYPSNSNFRKYFTKKFGVSPREYRKQFIPLPPHPAGQREQSPVKTAVSDG